MSKKLNIDGYHIELEDNFRPDDHYHYVCEIVIDGHFVGELCRERAPDIFDVDYDNREECLQAGIPQDIINKAIEAAKKCLYALTDHEKNQNARGLFDSLFEDNPEAVAFHYPPEEGGVVFKILNIDGYRIYFYDWDNPDAQASCEININGLYVGGLCLKKESLDFELHNDERAHCLAFGIPPEIIHKAIEACKKRLKNI